MRPVEPWGPPQADRAAAERPGIAAGAPAHRPGGEWAALAGLLVLGAGLRLHDLAAESLWLDEAFSITIARVSPDYIVEMTAQDVHPPLYYFLLYVWMGILGSSEWDARLLSVVLSLVTVIVAAVAGGRIFGRRTGLIAAGLLAVAPFQVEYAQEARMYAMLALLGTVATWCLFEVYVRVSPGAPPTAALGGAPGPRSAAGWLLAYIVVTAMLTYTQVHSLFVLAAHAAVVAIDLARRSRRALPFAARWAGAQVAVLLAFLPWLPTFVGQVSHVQSGFWIPAPDWTALSAALVAYAGSERLLWLAAPLALAGLWRAWREPDPMPAIVVTAWLIGPLVLPFVLSLIGSSIFLPKYTIASSVAFTLLAANGVGAMPRLAQVAVLSVVIGLSLQALAPYYTGVRKDDWRTAVRQVERRARPGDVVVFYPFYTKIAYDMYETRPDVARVPFPRHAESASDEAVVEMIDPLVTDAGRVWLVTMSFDPRKPLIVEALAARFREGERVSAFHVDAHLFTGP